MTYPSLQSWLRATLTGTLLLAAATPSFALPAFARQTGSECSACHIAGVGPHLTPHGIRFKLSGYTDGDKDTLPLSAQLRVSDNELEQPSSKASTRLDEASLYVAGRLAPKIGAFIKVMNSNDPFNSGAKSNTELNNVDIRFADTGTLFGRDATWGLSLNNAPGVQDPLDDNQIWGFPAIGTNGSLLNGSSRTTLARRSLGLTASAWIDNHWYAEAGGYRSMNRDLQDNLGQDLENDPGRLSGLAPYWRLAYLHDFKTQFIGFGVYGMDARRQLAVTSNQPRVTARTGPKDHLTDVGIDAIYEYLGNREHILQVRGNYVHEKRRYGSTPANPFTGAVALGSGTVKERTLALTYVFQQSYGWTTAWLSNKASSDPVRFFPNGNPNTKTQYNELFWTPFGHENSWGAPFANLRLSAVWNHFDKFNGSKHNIFGPGSQSARDLDSFQVYAQLTF